MAGNVLKYKGYFAKVAYSAEDRLLHGKIEGIRDLITFQCDSAEAVEREFHTAVDDYLAFCADIGQVPDKPNEQIKVYSTEDIDLKLEQLKIRLKKTGRTETSTLRLFGYACRRQSPYFGKARRQSRNKAKIEALNKEPKKELKE